MEEIKWVDKVGIWVANFNDLSAIVFPATEASKKQTKYVYVVTYASYEKDVLKSIDDNDIHSTAKLLETKIGVPILVTWNTAYPLEVALKSADHDLRMTFVNISINFAHAKDMTEDEFNVLKSAGIIGGDYNNWKLLHYEDDKIRCWINTDREGYLKFKENYEKFKEGETNKMTVDGWGEYPPKLNRKYLTEAQIDHLKSLGWKDDEIGSDVA